MSDLRGRTIDLYLVEGSAYGLKTLNIRDMCTERMHSYPERRTTVCQGYPGLASHGRMVEKKLHTLDSGTTAESGMTIQCPNVPNLLLSSSKMFLS